MNMVLILPERMRGRHRIMKFINEIYIFGESLGVPPTITNLITTIGPRPDRGIFLILLRKIIVPDLKEPNRLTGLQVIAN